MDTTKKAENPKEKFPGYPHYPPSEDIYSQSKEESEIDPENPTMNKPNNYNGKFNEKNFNQDHSGTDLDIPGADLDDNQEDIGSEDEENNGYSLGGDNHQNLEENQESI